METDVTLANKYFQYYFSQANQSSAHSYIRGRGSGGQEVYFRGVRFQRPYFSGRGWWSNAWGNVFKPFLKNVGIDLGKEALKAGADITKDLIAGKDLKSTLKEQLATHGKEFASSTLDRLREQVGSGLKRRRKRVTALVAPKKTKGNRGLAYLKLFNKIKQLSKIRETKRKRKKKTTKKKGKKKTAGRRKRRAPKTQYKKLLF
jgi:hypothetical protein